MYSLLEANSAVCHILMNLFRNSVEDMTEIALVLRVFFFNCYSEVDESVVLLPALKPSTLVQ